MLAAVKAEPVAAEFIKRWYSMGRIYIADFDADGFVKQEDQDLFYQTLLLGDPPPPQRALRVFATGHIDGDGVIEPAGDDLAMFNAAFNAHAAVHGLPSPVPANSLSQALPVTYDYGIANGE